MIHELKNSLIDIGSDIDPELLIQDIITHYSESRAYHNWDHILHCYINYKESKDLFLNPSTALIAILTHDIIYDPKRTDNELKSALYMQDVLEGNCRYDALQKIISGILATRHESCPYDHDNKLIQDIDLCIFGQEWEKFLEYDTKIHQEFSFVPEEKYVPARIAVLEYFLNRGLIYHSEYFRDKYEKNAQQNLEKKLIMLQYDIN